MIIKAIRHRNIAISLELFELLAAADVVSLFFLGGTSITFLLQPPIEQLFEATIKSPFFRTHAEAAEMLEPGNPDATYSEVIHLDAWIQGFEHVLMNKVNYLESAAFHRPDQLPTANPFVLVSVIHAIWLY